MEVGKLKVKIDVDSTDVSAATEALDKLTDAAGRAADALDRLLGVKPVEDVAISVGGDNWLADLANQLIQEIYKQSKNGRVIIAKN